MRGWTWWHKPAILATWKVEIRGLQFEASLGEKLARHHLNKHAGCGGTYV
jgi:ribosomal protein L32